MTNTSTSMISRKWITGLAVLIIALVTISMGCSKTTRGNLTSLPKPSPNFESVDTFYLPPTSIEYRDVQNRESPRSPVFIPGEGSEIVLIKDQYDTDSRFKILPKHSRLMIYHLGKKSSAFLTEEMDKIRSLHFSDHDKLMFDTSSEIWTMKSNGKSLDCINFSSCWLAMSPSGRYIGFPQGLDKYHSTQLIYDTQSHDIDSLYFTNEEDLTYGFSHHVHWHSEDIILAKCKKGDENGIGNIDMTTKEVTDFVPWTIFPFDTHNARQCKYDPATNTCLILILNKGLYQIDFDLEWATPIKRDDKWHRIVDFDWLPSKSQCVIEVDRFSYEKGPGKHRNTRQIEKEILIMDISGTILDTLDVR